MDRARIIDRIAAAARAEKPRGPDIIQQGSPVRFPDSVKFFEVVSASAGWGLYLCREIIVNKITWPAVTVYDKFTPKGLASVEVLNLHETYPGSDAGYWHALAKFDKMVAWQVFDNGKLHRWVGVPLESSTRRVRAVYDAGDYPYVTCNLLKIDGNPAAFGQPGYNIRVYANNYSSAVKLKNYSPPILTGYNYPAYCLEGTWFFAFTFILKNLNVRWAVTQAAAGSGDTVVCNIFNSDIDGVEFYSQTVIGLISGGTALNAAIPRILSEAYFLVIKNAAGVWHFIQRFQTIGDGLEIDSNNKLKVKLTACT